MNHDDVTARRRLPRSTPEEQGVDPRALTALVGELTAVPELHSVMVVRHGHVVAEGWAAPYAPDVVHEVYSLSKSFTATAVGLAVGDGLLDLDDRLVDLLPEAVPTASADEGGLTADERDRLGRLTVRDLLTMRTGHHEDPSEAAILGGRPWTVGFLAQPLAHEPGTHFVYNTVASYVLAAIVHRVTGQSVLDRLHARVLGPLGFVGPTWYVSPEGIETGGFGLSATTEDIATFGELFLRDGVWAGRRLLPEGWVAQASAAHVPPGTNPGDEHSDWAQGYGFQMWQSRHGYRGDGAFGQFCVILPEQDVVVAMTSAFADLQRPLDAVWTHLLPALTDHPAPDDPDGRAGLHRALADLALPWPQGAATSPRAGALDGRRLELEPNALGLSAVRLTAGPEQDSIELELADGATVTLVAGHAAPVAGVLPPEPPFHPEARPVLAHAVWTAEDEYVLTVRLTRDVTALTARVVLTQDHVRIEPRLNVSFDDPVLPVLRGRVTTTAPSTPGA
ncbi:serine hydrolase domain-containing protein [Cellulomonas sp.]|uniref:serine hydrolase domain-containing protein n=1 Tax=Cellulomonas sp. TaxID=40001 RepID=UPI00258900F3|nr:serine hydrolase domain-containing protein [Cellulomonas sp.]MCR6688970.1 beta-lactamase family protein [Cellulomonas sp.]